MTTNLKYRIDKLVDKIVVLSADDKKIKQYRDKLYELTLDQLKTNQVVILSLIKQVKRLSLDVGSSPCIDINRMIDDVNVLGNLVNLDCRIAQLKGEYSADAAIVVTSRVEPAIPLTLKSGLKLILTTRTLDLNQFSNDELHEILSVLDVLAPDDRYDTLRTTLTEEISRRT